MQEVLIASRENVGLGTNRRQQHRVVFWVEWNDAGQGLWQLHYRGRLVERSDEVADTMLIAAVQRLNLRASHHAEQFRQ